MVLEYVDLNSITDAPMIEGVIKLHTSIFNDTDNLIKQMESKPNLLINIALDGIRVIGYKIGYSSKSC